MSKQLSLTPTNGQNVPNGREIQQQQRALPTLEELRDENSNEQWAKENALHVLLNSEPPSQWLSKHPTVTRKVNGRTVDYLYIPAERQEWLMTRLFVNWHLEVKTVQLLANAICVTVRVHYQNPVTGQWSWTDGVGATALQTDKDKPATDFQHIKSAAVQMAAPAAETYAFKDAVEKLGKLFGKDINRNSEIDYTGLLSQFDSVPIDTTQAETIKALLKAGKGSVTAFLEYMGAASVEEIRKSDYRKAIAQLNHKANA